MNTANRNCMIPSAYALASVDLAMIGSQPKTLRWWADYLGYANAQCVLQAFRVLIEHDRARAVQWGKTGKRHRYILTTPF